jgi:hypothetical protein
MPQINWIKKDFFVCHEFHELARIIFTQRISENS